MLIISRGECSSHLNIGSVYRVGQVEIGHSSKTSLIQETEGENLSSRNTSLYKIQGFVIVTCSFWGEFELKLYIICLDS